MGFGERVVHLVKPAILHRTLVYQTRQITLIDDTDRMVAEVEARLLVEGNVRVGDTLVILAGAPITARAETNLLKLHRVGDAHAAGQ